MATRDITPRFEKARRKHRTQQKRRRQVENGHHALIDTEDTGLSDISITMTHGSPASATMDMLPPEWVDIVETIQGDLSTIRDQLKTLQRLHARRLKVSFGDDEEAQDREIEAVRRDIAALFKRSETALKRIATVGNERGQQLPQQERVVRLNVMRSLAVTLQQQSRAFRLAQRDHVVKLKNQEESGGWDDAGGAVVGGADGSGMTLEEAMAGGLDDAQLAELEQMQQTSSKRDQAILDVAQSINDLATIFKELSVLVIEQGTILDRIDYNVEQTLDRVKEGSKELEKANEHSKKAKTMKCIIFFVLLIIVMATMLVYKHCDSC